MMKTGLMIVSNPKQYTRLIPRLQTDLKNRLYIHFIAKNQKLTNYGPNFSSTMINLYRNSVCIRNLDVRVLLHKPITSKISNNFPIDIIYYEEEILPEGFLEECVNKSLDCQKIQIDSISETDNLEQSDDTKYDYVVVGGTFDRLHLGHKILLSEAVLRCKKKLTVGVTDVNMLKNKKLWELIEPCDTRINNVIEFLLDIEPKLEYSVIPISDMFGPTRTEPTFQMLVVSKETVKGGIIINEEREKNGLKPLVVHSVELINDYKCDEIEEDKISSSNDRMRILGHKLNKPVNNPKRPVRPYIIGLCGGIASGKSSIGQKLKNMGAGVIDCDQVAHELYKIGEDAYQLVVEHFGDKILDENRSINRSALGNIVFNNKKELEKLNSILWPEILKKCEIMIDKLHQNESKQVVFLDAAVLLVAGWDKHCHEVWTCIIPQEEAIKRIMDRNNLSTEQAMARISSQPSNFEQIQKAHVVFCTLWTYEYTQKQVEKAWKELQNRIPCS